jgi:hypothetical protein
MAFASSRRVAAGVFLVVSGCTGGGQSTPHPPGSGLDAGAPALEGLKFDVAAGLECSGGSSGGICLAPSQIVTVGIEGPAGTVVNLSLEGNYGDAALTTGQVTLGATPAHVTLECSSTTAAFTIIAQAGGQSVPLHVTVATSGSATVLASPIYSGHRLTPQFYATEYPLSTCAELTATAPDAGAAKWTAGPSGAPIALSVTAGERAAIQMRIGHYAFGCADVDPLVPAASIALPVQVYDIPMALALTNLAASFPFSFDPKGTSWTNVAGAATSRIKWAFFGASSPDATVLLDAMAGAITDPAGQAQFDQLRQSQGWDGTTKTWLAAMPHLPRIGDRAAAWLNAAATDTVGPLVLQIGAATGTGTAPVFATTLGGLSWNAAGISQPPPFQWTADANDTIHIEGAIDLASTPLFAHEADLKAAGTVKGAVDCPSAVAAGIDCGGLGMQLAAKTGVSYGTCDATCTGNLCASALAAVWSAAAAPAAGGADIIHTTITASAPATVGDLAEPAYVTGGWLGNMAGAGVPTPFAVSGNLLATEPPPPAPP